MTSSRRMPVESIKSWWRSFGSAAIAILQTLFYSNGVQHEHSYHRGRKSPGQGDPVPLYLRSQPYHVHVAVDARARSTHYRERRCSHDNHQEQHHDRSDFH